MQHLTSPQENNVIFKFILIKQTCMDYLLCARHWKDTKISKRHDDDKIDEEDDK